MTCRLCPMARAGKSNLSISRTVEEFAGSIGRGVEVEVVRRGADGAYRVVVRRLVPVEAAAAP